LTFEGIKMKAKDKVIGLLEKNLLPFAPEDIRWVIEAYGLEAEDEEVLTQEVVAEGLKRTTNALHAFFESVGHPPLPKELAEVEETLRKGGTVRAWCLPNERTSLGRSSVTVEVEDQRESKKVSFPGFGVFGELYLRAFMGVVDIETSMGLEVNSSGWAFFKAYSEETIEEALRTAISLRPVLSAMAIPDLEYALIDLRDMEEGGRWIEGSCTLIRDGRVWVLKRGSLVDDPDLDGALLRGGTRHPFLSRRRGNSLQGEVFQGPTLLGPRAFSLWGRGCPFWPRRRVFQLSHRCNSRYARSAMGAFPKVQALGRNRRRLFLRGIVL
jgi:hypothetical protein